MKQQLFTLFLLLVGTSALMAQQSCCAVATGMAQFASDEAFRRSHAEPLPYCHQSENGQMITFATPDGQTANGYLLKAAKPSKKWLLVYQEWWGLNDYIKKQSETFWTDLGDVNVLAVDMYDGKVATTRDSAAKYMQAATPERLAAIQQGALQYIGPKARIASVGWCFGGGLSLQSAIHAGKRAKACIMYYGMPEKDPAKLKKLRTDVLCFIAAKDKWITPAVGDEFVSNMTTARKKATIKVYDADHAFANPSNPNFDTTASADAYRLSLEYLRKRL